MVRIASGGRLRTARGRPHKSHPSAIPSRTNHDSPLLTADPRISADRDLVFWSFDFENSLENIGKSIAFEFASEVRDHLESIVAIASSVFANPVGNNVVVGAFDETSADGVAEL